MRTFAIFSVFMSEYKHSRVILLSDAILRWFTLYCLWQFSPAQWRNISVQGFESDQEFPTWKHLRKFDRASAGKSASQKHRKNTNLFLVVAMRLNFAVRKVILPPGIAKLMRNGLYQPEKKGGKTEHVSNSDHGSFHSSVPISQKKKYFACFLSLSLLGF